jgi:hypothetical protein
VVALDYEIAQEQASALGRLGRASKRHSPHCPDTKPRIRKPI